jgi:hypothetical protein
MKTVEVEFPGRPRDLHVLSGIAFSHRPLVRTAKVEPALAAFFRGQKR